MKSEIISLYISEKLVHPPAIQGGNATSQHGTKGTHPYFDFISISPNYLVTLVKPNDTPTTIDSRKPVQPIGTANQKPRMTVRQLALAQAVERAREKMGASIVATKKVTSVQANQLSEASVKVPRKPRNGTKRNFFPLNCILLKVSHFWN